MIHASAGCGKTSLLTQWWAALRTRKIASAWLSLDRDDNEPRLFTAYLVASVKKAVRGQRNVTDLLDRNLPDIPPKSIVALLINALTEFKDRIVIIIDDYDCITNDNIHELLQLLLTRAPGNVHVTLSGRSTPPIDLADLAIRDKLLNISAADLRVSLEEADQLFRQSSHPELSLSRDDISMLLDRTEGWMMAMQMVKLWSFGRKDRAELIRSFSGRMTDLAQYLSEQVYGGLDEELQEFLMSTSLFERINGDLANAVCGCTNSWNLLEDLERRELFIYAIDMQRRWYRYHRLFREFLHERLQRQYPQRINEIHSAAATWFAQHGYLAEAIRHTKDEETSLIVAELVEQAGGWRLYLEGNQSLLRLALKSFDQTVISRFPRLTLGNVYCLLKEGKISEARREFEQVKKASQDFSELNCRKLDSVIKAESTLIDYCIAGYEDKPVTGGDLDILESLRGSFPENETLLKGIINTTLCLNCLSAGMDDRAIEAGDQAIADFRTIHSAYGELFIYFHEGRACLSQGRLRDAEAMYREGQNMVLKHFRDDSALTAIAASYMGEVLYKGNHLQEAKRQIELALPTIDNYDAWFEVYHAAYLTAAAVARATEGVVSAGETLARMRHIGQIRGISRLKAFADIQATANLLWAGRVDEARAIVEENKMETGFRNYRPDNLAGQMLYEYQGITLARLEIAQKHYRLAIEYFDLVQPDMERRGHLLRLLECEILRAIAYFSNGDRISALHSLSRAVTRALFEKLKRPFIDEGLLMLPVLIELIRDSRMKGSNRLRDAFMSEIRTSIESETRIARRRERHGILSAREQDVLKELSRGLSNKEIARHLEVGENTVKYHLKNIYGKLGVDSRESAVIAAERMSLLM
ncbi:MAG: hypothetical protein HY708_06650 [Ignavibacteriae bacterium]|nr:hypothetical protein [Ignavibacteriota bacterium]